MKPVRLVGIAAVTLLLVGPLALVAVTIPPGVTPTADGPGTADESPTTDGSSGADGSSTADGEPADPTPANVSVRNGTLPIDVGRTFTRVEDMLGTDVPDPRFVRAYDDRETYENESVCARLSQRAIPFLERLGMRFDEALDESVLRTQPAGCRTSSGVIELFPGENASRDQVRYLTVHEFVHYVQLQRGDVQQINRGLGRTIDEGYVGTALLEGSAVFTTDAYMARYTDNGTRNTELYHRFNAQLPPGHVGRFSNSAYLNGSRYVESRVDSPDSLQSVYEDPPTTSEQVLHELPPGSEPPAPLEVTARTGETWRHVGSDRLGEAALRHVLAAHVDRERAIRAASGWGNDSVLTFRSPDAAASSFVLVHRWDDAANATEFAEAMGAAFDRRGNRSDARWSIDDTDAARLETGDRTTVLLFGTRAFLDATAVDVDGAAVTVRTGLDESGAD